MKLKQVFHKLDKGEHGALRLTATDENCRDLEWFCSRYAIEIDPASLLEARARSFDQRMDMCASILAGQRDIPNPEMVLPPRDYQRQAAALCLATGALLLADDLGLGKTVVGITLLAYPQTLPALVVCPVHLLRQWKRELNRFVPGLKVHVAKKAKANTQADKKIVGADVVVMNYHKLTGWADQLAGEIKTVVYDECQELRNPKSQRYTAAFHISEAADFRLGLSATPIYNYGSEFYWVLSALKPGTLGDRGEFLREWCTGEDDRTATIKDPKVFGSYLREHALMLRRTRAEVGRELPACSKIVQEVDSDPKALADIADAATELANIIVSQQGGFQIMRASSEFSNRLRQATGIAKAPYVAEFVRMLLEQGEPVVLFGWHRAVYDIWASRLAAFRPAWCTGTESSARKDHELNRFKSGETNLLILSLRAGAGIDGLQHRCCTGVFGELDWSSGAMDQCGGRVHRDEQTRPVFLYYLVANDGADPYMIDALGVKREQLEGVRDTDAQVVEDAQVDPDHVKKLAAEYLAKKGKRA
jgi:hypothetical protein